jgi:hypothetical protein
VASGHYTVPFIPKIPGLAEFAKSYLGAVEHSKGFRGPEKYRGKVRAASKKDSMHLAKRLRSVW